MLIHRLQASGILSFGPKGINLPMRKLNVLIGPNGSGKSNLLEVISLFAATPTPRFSVAGPMLYGGGPDEWMWKGDWKLDDAPPPARITCDVELNRALIRHHLEMHATPQRFRVVDESIEIANARKRKGVPWWFYRMNVSPTPLVAQLHDWTGPNGDEKVTQIDHDRLDTTLSILAQIRDPQRYLVFQELEKAYSKIALHRDWTFGQQSPARKPTKPDDRDDALYRSGQNLARVAAKLKGRDKKKLVETLQILYAGIVDYHVRPVAGGALQLFIEEEQGVEISAERLSDGTLRYLALLLILLDPSPPPLIAIEEPELGLHPDVIRELAKVLLEASERTQIIVTTHSRMLVDCLGDDPESIIVCEKHEGESVFERLEGKRMKVWLEKYSLGDLWSKGELGGNRW